MKKTKTPKKKLTNQQMRVAIVKDVLKQIEARKIIARSMTYLYTEKPLNLGDLQKQIPGLGKCQVCALGALFLSHVSLNDEFFVTPFSAGGRGVSSFEIENALEVYFSTRILKGAEKVFEGWTYETEFPALDILHARLGDTERLQWICREIIRQGGQFNLVTANQKAAKDFPESAKEPE